MSIPGQNAQANAYLHQIVAALTGTLDPGKQAASEHLLNQLANSHPLRDQFVTMLLRVVCQNTVDMSVRQAAGIKFKNCISKGWEYHDDHREIPEALKPTLRAQMIDIMCQVPRLLQSQVSEAVRVMALVDFPQKWPTLIRSLVEKMTGSSEPQTIIGVLKTAHEILKQFRGMSDSHETLSKLKAALDQFSDPLTKFFQRVSHMAKASQANKKSLELLYEALRLMSEIFYSFNWYTIPEYFEDNLKPWMTEFHNLLNPQTDLGKIFAEPQNQDQQTPREKLRSAIVSCVAIYAEKYEEEFRPYFGGFLRTIVQLLMSSPLHSRYDNLVINGLNFLSHAVLKQANKSVFGGAGFLRNLVEKVVYPNITMHQGDVDEFEDNPEEFVRRDIESSDKYTRRKAACDLLRNLRRNFNDEISNLSLMVIQTLLSKHASNPQLQASWIGKETALQMYIAVVVSGVTVARGVSNKCINPQVNAKAPVATFFMTHVLPEMKNPAAHPVLKAAALKFISIFRQQLASPQLVQALAPLLVHKSEVVHTYAANCLERVLVMRDAGGKHRVPAAALTPIAVPVLKNLFSIVNNAEYPDNPYVMKAIMRVLSVCDTALAGNTTFLGQLIESLCMSLRRVIKQSTSPQFNHYVFDSMAALVGASCGTNKGMVQNFMTKFLPEFQPILANGDSDFYPYALQMLAQLLSFATPGSPLTPTFQSLLDSLMTDAMWENRGLIPATVQLLQIYFRVAPGHLVTSQYHVKILSIFQKLVRKQKTEEYGLKLLKALLSCLPLDTLKPYLGQIMLVIGRRLLDKKRQGRRFKTYVTAFLGFFVSKFAVAGLQEAWKVPNLPLSTLVTNVWAPSANTVKGINERKVVAIGSVMLLVDPAVMRNPSLFQPLLEALLDMLEVSTMDLDATPTFDAEEIEFASSGAFRKLHAARLSDSVKDFYAKIPNTRKYFRDRLIGLVKANPAIMSICTNLKKKDHKLAIQQIFATSGGAPAQTVSSFGVANTPLSAPGF